MNTYNMTVPSYEHTFYSLYPNSRCYPDAKNPPYGEHIPHPSFRDNEAHQNSKEDTHEYPNLTPPLPQDLEHGLYSHTSLPISLETMALNAYHIATPMGDFHY